MKIKLNFLENYYPFYEWLSTDNVKEYSNFNFYITSTKKINNLITNKLNFKLDKVAIITDSYSFLAIYHNKKSSLLYEDEEKLLNVINTAKKLDVEYKLIGKEKKDDCLRYERFIQKKLSEEIENLKKENNIDKIKFLYNEWFDKNSNDIDKIFKKMQNKIENSIDENDIKFYNLVKNGYK